MLRNEAFPVQLADIWKQGEMFFSLAVHLWFPERPFLKVMSLSRALTLRCKGTPLSSVLLLSEPHLGRAGIPKTSSSLTPHQSPFPISTWLSCAHLLISWLLPPLPRSDEDGMGTTHPHRWCFCSSTEGATQIEDLTRKADAIYIFLGNWTWHCWFPETMLWKWVAISSKYREVEVKGIHREINK